MLWNVGETVVMVQMYMLWNVGGPVVMVHMHMLWNVGGTIVMVACVTFAFRCPHFLEFFLTLINFQLWAFYYRVCLSLCFSCWIALCYWLIVSKKAAKVGGCSNFVYQFVLKLPSFRSPFVGIFLNKLIVHSKHVFYYLFKNTITKI